MIHHRAVRVLPTLALLSLLGWAGVMLAQELDFGSTRFVTRSEDPGSDVTVSGGVGSVFANQNVKFQFNFTVLGGIANSFTLRVVALTVPSDGSAQETIVLQPSDADGNQQLFCQTGQANTDISGADSVACIDVPLDPTINQTSVRVRFNVAELTEVVGGQFGEFDLFAIVEFDNGNTLQTSDDTFLRLQVAGENQE